MPTADVFSVVKATLEGASLGEELGILEKPGGRPGLTELGKQVFALMYHHLTVSCQRALTFYVFHSGIFEMIFNFF